MRRMTSTGLSLTCSGYSIPDSTLRGHCRTSVRYYTRKLASTGLWTGYAAILESPGRRRWRSETDTTTFTCCAGAGLAVTVEDAVPEALEVADRVAPPMQEDGVARVLEDLLGPGPDRIAPPRGLP